MGQSQSVPKLSEVSSCQSASSLDSCVSSSAKRSCKVDGQVDGQSITFPKDLKDFASRNVKVKVKSLGIYMEPLQSKLSFPLSAMPFTHHFLIIDVDCIEMPDGEEEKLGYYIMAEKGQEENSGMITVKCLKKLPRSPKRVCKLADCGSIPMQKVLDILEKPSSDYCVWTENCWKYADLTFRGLVEEFSNGAEPGSVTKERLQSYLKDLPVLRMPGDAFSLSPAEALTCSAPPAAAGWTYLSEIAYVAGQAALAVPVVVGLGSPIPLAGPVAVQVSLKFGAAAAVKPFLGTVIANQVPGFSAAALKAAILKGGFIPVAGAHSVAHSQSWLCAAATAIGSPHVLLTALAVVAGGFAGLVMAWLIYKFVRGVWTGFKDDMTFIEFVGYIFKGSWQCLCFGLKWVGKQAVTLFKWFFESIESWFKGSGRPYGHTVSDGDTEPLKRLLDGHTESEGGIESFIGHTEFNGDTQPLIR